MENTLELINVKKKYKDIVALNEINITFKNGVNALLGHNGAGKSTMIDIITSQIHYEGYVIYNGKNIITNKRQYLSEIGVVFQNQNLDFEMTCEEFLVYICGLKSIKNHKEVVVKLMNDLDIYRYKNKRMESLSGGMRQRVLIAQAMLNNPRVLLLDEPTVGLDPEQRKKFRNIISKIAKDRIVIISTHVISDVELIANNIIFLKEGRVLEINTQENLINSTLVYESFEDIEKLKKIDNSIKITNTMNVNGKIKTRFISDKIYENRVNTTLDDVYLDRLGDYDN